MAIEDDMNFVINKIREIRIEKKISQLELANIANFSQSFLANVESGKKKPSLLTILRIAEALNVNLYQSIKVDKLLSFYSSLK